MGRFIGPTNKIARRFGINLGLKTNATKVARRLTQRPGVHGAKRQKKSVSSFGKQLQEKQKVKFVYGLREKQLRKYVAEAGRAEGDSGMRLQRILEMRMDNVVYRLGFAVTRAQARQMVGHGMFLLNGKKMTIPSHIVRVGDEITVKENKGKKKLFTGLEERLAQYTSPSWVSMDAKAVKGKVVSLPQNEDFEKTFDIKFVIEYFSTR